MARRWQMKDTRADGDRAAVSVEDGTARKPGEGEPCASEQCYRELSAQMVRQVEASTAEIRAAHAALRDSEERFRAIFDSVIDAIFILDLDGYILAVNEHACRQYGYSRDQFLHLHITAIDTPEDAVHAPARLAAVDRDGQVAFEAHHRDAQGRPLMVEVRASKILFNGRPAMLSVVRDVTERRRAQRMVEYLAYYDPLTGLPNRLLGLDRLAQQVAQAQRHQRHLAVLYLDLDHFKHINDCCGHPLGDQLLRDLGQRLSRHLRAEDTLCRLGGDEFMLVLADVDGDQGLADLVSLCERLLALHADPFDLDGHQVYVSLSMGVALYPGDGGDGETLMRHADTALYAAKRAGRQTFRFFEPRMNEELTRFIQTRDALRAALERQEFVLHYQPRIELHSGRMVVVEALVRWQRPGVGLVMPGDFIDVAEESGLIVPLGRWVLAEACRQAVAWRQAGWPDLVMAVNLSTVQFRRGGIGAEVLAALEASSLPPAGLELELTESILLEGAEDVLATVSTWKAAGIQLAIDDFGTGYSSLAYLKRFQVDKLKIDRSFISGMAEHDQDRAIVQAIIDMASALDLGTIAEGVEDALQARQLHYMGCDEAQGCLYTRPMAVEEFMPPFVDPPPLDKEPLAPERFALILGQARDRLLADLANSPDLIALARECGTNRTTLQQIFQAELGMSVFGYLREQRLQRARTLLVEGEHGIEVIARIVGYDHGHNFTRAFKQRFGIVPSQFYTSACNRRSDSGLIQMSSAPIDTTAETAAERDMPASGTASVGRNS